MGSGFRAYRGSAGRSGSMCILHINGIGWQIYTTMIVYGV